MVDMRNLALYLLGDLRFEIDGESVGGITTDKARALLVYLAIEGSRPLRREALAEIFWPQRPPGVGRASLRQAIGNLRSALDDRQASSPFLHTSRDQIQFNTDDNLWIDSVEVQGLLETVRGHGHQFGDSCKSCEDILSQALDLCKGDFLAEFSLPNSQAFSEWATVQREALHRQISTALRLHVSLLEARGAYEEACRQARKLVVHEPWSEDNHRILMRLLAIIGRRSEALRQFKVCRRILDEEFNTAPADITLTLHQQILDGQIQVLKKTPIATHPAQDAKAIRTGSRWQDYMALGIGAVALVALVWFGLRSLGILGGGAPGELATSRSPGFSPLSEISPTVPAAIGEFPTVDLAPSRICGEEAFNGNLQTPDPVFMSQNGFYAGWISLDPSTIILPDNTAMTFTTPLVLIVEDLSWVQIEGAAMGAGYANAWGCWYSGDQTEVVEADAIIDLCMKQAGGLYAVLYRVSSEGIEDLGTTDTIPCQ